MPSRIRKTVCVTSPAPTSSTASLMKPWRFCQKPNRECSSPRMYRAIVRNSIQPTKVSPKGKIYHRGAENAEKTWVFGGSAAKTNHGDTEYTEKIQFAFSVSFCELRG